MVDYVIGDVQGCYDPLCRLLDSVHFNERVDRLWFVGDLVNRGPQSLEVLRFIKNLPIKPRVTLGNHDLHLLSRIFVDSTRSSFKSAPDDTLHSVVNADDAHELGHWLRQQSILYHEPSLNVVMTHAGIPPMWDLAQAKRGAEELETVLQSADFIDFLANMYGNQPDVWSESLVGWPRLRLITNYFTRMRFFDAQACLDFSYAGTIVKAPTDLTPWFLVKNRQLISVDIVFGHWAALDGQCAVPGLYALDTGCVWGQRLTALRLQDRRLFSAPGLSLTG